MQNARAQLKHLSDKLKYHIESLLSNLESKQIELVPLVTQVRSLMNKEIT